MIWIFKKSPDKSQISYFLLCNYIDLFIPVAILESDRLFYHAQSHQLAGDKGHTIWPGIRYSVHMGMATLSCSNGLSGLNLEWYTLCYYFFKFYLLFYLLFHLFILFIILFIYYLFQSTVVSKTNVCNRQLLSSGRWERWHHYRLSL